MFLTRLKAIMSHRKTLWHFWVLNIITKIIIITIIGLPLSNIYDQHICKAGIYCNEVVWKRYEVSKL